MKLTKAIVYVAKVNQVEVDVDWSEEITLESWHETLARLRAVVEATQRPEPTYTPGFHCSERYCRARKKCEAYKAFKNERIVL